MENKTYTITKENRVSNSPFTIEGSDMKLDITHEHPVPTETIAIINGSQREIRFIMGCDTIFKDEQIAKGFPLKRSPLPMERAMLTFIGGMLTVPPGYGVLEKYLEAAPWFKGRPDQEKTKIRPPGSRTIYELYDQEQIDAEELDMEMLVNEARNIVLNGDKETLLSLLRLSRPGNVVDKNTNLKQAKLQLLEVANNNPDFILKAAKSAGNDNTVWVSKGLDYDILNLDKPGKVMMQRKDDSTKYYEIAKIPDFGGRNAKIERTVAFFESEDGRHVFNELKKRCKEFEDREGINVDEENEPDDDWNIKQLNSTSTTKATTTTTTTQQTTTTTTAAPESSTTTVKASRG